MKCCLICVNFVSLINCMRSQTVTLKKVLQWSVILSKNLNLFLFLFIIYEYANMECKYAIELQFFFFFFELLPEECCEKADNKIFFEIFFCLWGLDMWCELQLNALFGFAFCMQNIQYIRFQFLLVHKIVILDY